MPAHRLVRREQVHLTVQFIGDTPSRDMDAVVESVRRSASGLGAFELTPRSIVALPEQGPSRLIAAATDAPPALLELHRRLAHRLARNARERPGDRFMPHLTLARFDSPVNQPLGPRELEMKPFRVSEVALMRSVLRSEGAEHVVVERVRLE